MSETQEIKDGLTVLEETEGREDATYDHIVKYTGFLGGIQVLTILVSVVRNKLAAVLLSTAGVGLSALYQSVIGFLHNTSNLGISFSSIKEIAEYYGENHPEKVLLQVEVVRTWSVWTGLAGMLLCLLFSPAISYWAFGDTSHILPLCLLSPVMGFMAVTVGEISILKAVEACGFDFRVGGSGHFAADGSFLLLLGNVGGCTCLGRQYVGGDGGSSVPFASRLSLARGLAEPGVFPQGMEHGARRRALYHGHGGEHVGGDGDFSFHYQLGLVVRRGLVRYGV